MVTIRVESKIVNSAHEQLKKALGPDAMKRLADTAARDMVAQVRRNVLTEGKPSGGFAPLSSGYAAQKDRDKAKGKIPFDGKVRWMRTGHLVENLIANVVLTSGGFSVSLDATGSSDDGTPYSDVLRFMIEGTSRMPARDPTRNMSQFEKRQEAMLAKLV